MLNYLHSEESAIANMPDHPDWQKRAERAIMAADRLMFERFGDLAQPLWEAFWAGVPDAWMNANTWQALSRRNAAVLAYLNELPAGAAPDVAVMQAAYYGAAETPARPATEAL